MPRRACASSELPREAVARARRILLHDVRPEIEELLEGEQVLVCLLSPLPEADQHEILLQVPLFLGERVQASVLDGDRSLNRQRLCALHLVWCEGAMGFALA